MFRLPAVFALAADAVILLVITSQIAMCQISEVRTGASLHETPTKAGESEDLKVALRYEQILRKRPQSGTALDKFYDYHVRQKTLESFCATLQTEALNAKNGNQFLLLGLLQLKHGSYEDAAASLTRAEQLLPDDPLASLFRSQALSSVRQYDLALKAIGNAVNRSPTQAIALEIVSEIDKLAHRVGKDDSLVAIGLQLAKKYEANPQITERLAQFMLNMGQANSAKSLYERLFQITRDPLRRIEIRMQLAHIMKVLGQPEQCLHELEQLVEQVKPQSWLHAELLEQIEQQTVESHGLDGLIEYFQQRLSKRPEDVSMMLRLAKALSNRENFDDAKAWLEKALALAPTQPEPYVALADLLENTQQLDDAVNVMKQLLQIEPDNSDYIVRWGKLTAKSELSKFKAKSETAQASAAVEIWRQMLVGHENDPTRIVQVAELLHSVSMTGDAAKLYEQAVQASAGKLEYRELLGDYLHGAGRDVDAREVFKDAIEAAKGNRDGLIRLSEVLARIKFDEQALSAMQQACEQQPTVEHLLRFSKLLTEAKHFDQAIDVLNRALPVAQRTAEVTSIWDEQVSLYRKLDSLKEQAVALEKALQGRDLAAFDSLQRLAIMQSACMQPVDAARTAHKATAAEPSSALSWLLSARLHREASMSLRELDSLEMLCKLDTRNQADYLQRIASIQVQLNQYSEALTTVDRILALSSTTLQDYQFATTLCVNAKNTGKATEILRRATRVFASERSAWISLARHLSERKQWQESTDAAWQALALSTGAVQQREVVELMISLYSNLHGDHELMDRIAEFGQEHDRANDAALWTAWILNGNLHRTEANQLIARVLERGSTAPALLQTAVQLAVEARDLGAAIACQKRLLQTEKNAANQLKLGELLALYGDTSAAVSQWSNCMRVPANEAAGIVFAKDLISSNKSALAAEFINACLVSNADSWELLAFGIQANLQTNNFDRAAELADRLLLINKIPSTLVRTEVNEQAGVSRRDAPSTATDRLAWLEHAGVWQSLLNDVDLNRASYRSNQSNPRGAQIAAIRQLATLRGAALKPTSTNQWQLTCLAEARALALLAKFGKLNLRKPGVTDEWTTYLESAISNKDPERLWGCMLVMLPARSRSISVSTTGMIEQRLSDFPGMNRFTQVLDLLIELQEPAAIELSVSDIVTRRGIQYQMASSQNQIAPEIANTELLRLEQCIAKSEANNVPLTIASRVTLAIELTRCHRVTDGHKVLKRTLIEAHDIDKLIMTAKQFISVDLAVAKQLLLRAFELELEASASTGQLANALFDFSNSCTSPKTEFEALLLEMMRLQAKHIDSRPPNNLYFNAMGNLPRQQIRNGFANGAMTLSLDASLLLSPSLIAAVNNLLLEKDSKAINLLRQHLNTASHPNLSRAEAAVQLCCLAILQWSENQLDEALQSLQKAGEFRAAQEWVAILEVRMLVAGDRTQAAQEVLDTLASTDEAIRCECELLRLQIAQRTGDKTEAYRAAKVLAGMPISVADNAMVAKVLRECEIESK